MNMLPLEANIGIDHTQFLGDTITEIVLKPGRKRECIVHYKGLKYLYLKDVKGKILTLKKENNVKKTF